MRDFLPADIRKRNYVIGIIREVYEKYGFEPLETPSIENLSTLTNKYGEEGDQLMFKILKRGEKLAKELEEGKIKNENELTDLALRYDLTVPLARVVANYKNDLPKFFKRYQIQPVWRADRPARGRYREFYQCDVDAIGSKSMIVEAELCSAVSEIFERLGFDDFVIRINHRKVLIGILDSAGVSREKHSDALIALDKIDKIGTEGVVNELINKDIVNESAQGLFSLYEALSDENLSKQVGKEPIVKLQKLQKNIIQGDDEINWVFDWFEFIRDKLETLPSSVEGFISFHKNLATFKMIGEFIGGNSNGRKGIQELFLLLFLVSEKVKKHTKIDASLARGLSYYTGAIFEVVLTNGDFSGSIAGGGRYDGLIGMFGKEEIPAVGFSLGLERILLIMEERGEFERLEKEGKLETKSADVLVTIWNEETAGESLKLANELRQKDLRVLVYPQADKLGKQFKYADQIDVEYVCVLGENELAENTVQIKNMKKRKEKNIAREKLSKEHFSS
jgi:histidyl-tRNA synthetase